MQIPPGASLAQVLADHDATLLAALLGAQARAVDGRGIALDPDQPLVAGSIIRIIAGARSSDGLDA